MSSEGIGLSLNLPETMNRRQLAAPVEGGKIVDLKK
jgi:hypothetical protein